MRAICTAQSLASNEGGTARHQPQRLPLHVDIMRAVFACSPLVISSPAWAGDNGAPQRINDSVTEDFGWRHVVSYKVQQVMAGGRVVTRVALLTCALSGLCLLATAMYRMANPGMPFNKALFQTYSLLSGLPGASACDEPTRKSAAVAQVHLPIPFLLFSMCVAARTTHLVSSVQWCFLTGLCSFSILLALVSDAVYTSFNKVRAGNFPIAEVDHTVILNWNEQTPLLLECAHPRFAAGL